jgi:hypothetical protein
MAAAAVDAAFVQRATGACTAVRNNKSTNSQNKLQFPDHAGHGTATLKVCHMSECEQQCDVGVRLRQQFGDKGSTCLPSLVQLQD